MSDTEECPHGAPCECDLLATIERLKGEWMNLSDIVGDPMSPTGPISGIDRIAMAWGAGYRDGGYYADEVDLWSCLTCGALVRGLFKEMHKAYHAGGAR